VLNLLLLAGKILFLVVLYLFVFMVIRSAVRELRLTASSRAGGSRPLPFTDGAQAGAAAPSSADGHWALSVVESPVLPGGRSLALAPSATIRIGRAADNDLHLEDTFVSSHHARMSVTAEGFLLEDLGSTNGTFLNGQEADRAWLKPGDEVAIGDSVFRVEVH
jgi:hypothetical protein